MYGVAAWIFKSYLSYFLLAKVFRNIDIGHKTYT